MKLIIAGGRDFACTPGKLEEHYILGANAMNAVFQMHNITEVVCGKAKGADSFGESKAKANDIPVAEFPADWEVYGKRAGPVRNAQMGDYADMALIFWDGKSRGTKNMIDYMKKLKKPVILKMYNQGEDTDDEW